MECGTLTRAAPVDPDLTEIPIPGQEECEILESGILLTLCKECKLNGEDWEGMMCEEAALDPTGPAAYHVSGGRTELRRGWE